MKFFSFALLLGLLLSGGQLLARDYRYHIVIVNLSDERISDIQIFDSTQKFNYGGGYLVSLGYKSNAGPQSTPPNDVFTVRWLDAGNEARQQEFDLTKQIKTSFRGEIVFVFGEDKTFSVEIMNPPKRYPIP